MKTIEKALDILEILLDHDGEVSMPDLSRLSGLNNNSLYRITSTLRKRGYMKQKKERGRYALGPKFLEYSRLVKQSVKTEDIAYLYQEELCRKTGESTHFAVLDGQRAIAVDKQIIHTSQTLKVATEEGAELPLHCTAAGKILLANMSGKELETFINSYELQAFTDTTITNVSVLKKQLQEIRENDVAFDDEEFLLGVRAIASRVLDEKGNTVAAFGIFGPSARITRETMKGLTLLVKQYAETISRGIGYRGE